MIRSRAAIAGISTIERGAVGIGRGIVSFARDTATLRRGAAALVLAVVIACAGCTDDVTCPAPGDDTAPFIVGSIEESGHERAGVTSGIVFCSADPLPTTYIVSVNGRGLEEPDEIQEFGLTATLEETAVIWQPGTPCTLRVTTNYGFAEAAAVVPGPVVVSAPAEIVLGDTLTVTWDASDDADYYTLHATLEGESNETVAIEATVEGTSASIEPSSLPFAGDVTGYVVAVSGPFPDGGAGGNVTGAGRGFFTVSYHDAASTFEVTVSDAGVRYPPLARIRRDR